MTLYGAAKNPESVDNLTENGGDIGGTNDGDLPNLGSVSSSYTQAEIVAIRDAVRELAAQVNTLQEALKR